MAQLDDIYEALGAVPHGKVVTYGQLARLAGIHNGHRVAARAMRQCPSGLCWHRVVGKRDARRGQVNLTCPEHAREQRERLLAEGVTIDAGGAISLRDHGWLPLDG